MRRSRRISASQSAAAVLAGALVVGGLSSIIEMAPAAALSSQLTWSTVANVSDTPPGASAAFNSFNQPSVNKAGLVVFRARTKGSQQPVRGIYTRAMQGANQPIVAVAEVGGAVPSPNNSGGTFNEFPSFPEIDANSSNVVTRGQSTPVWTYSLNGTDTKIGTSGVYATTGGSGTFMTGASLLGAVPGQEVYQVPGAPAGTRFDQFPGAASIDGNTIAFKGNYTVGTSGLTGVYYRDLGQPNNPIEVIADTSTPIPNQPAGGTATFGAAAPPSAADNRAIFTAWDNEDAPTLGGVYLANLSPRPTLTTVAGIGELVPGQGPTDTFTNFGEGLSFDGRFAAFWGSWGTATTSLTLYCPSDGNADLLAFCNQQYPNGYTTSVPVHQGIFVYDTTTNHLYTVATTGDRFSSFQYWVYSGSPPTVGGGDTTREPPRWRVSAFAAVSGQNNGDYQVAFKGTQVTGPTGIFIGQGPGAETRVITAIQTGDLGTALDPAAPSDTYVSALGIERDGFRGDNLVINASMVNASASASWAGVYLAKVPGSLAMENQSVTFPSPGPAYLHDQAVLSASSSSGLPVTFALDGLSGAGVCSLSGATLTYTAVGTCVVNALQGGDAAYHPAQAQVSVPVTLRPQTISFVGPLTSYLGGHATLSASSSSGLPVTFSLDATSGVGVCTLSGSDLTYDALGTCVIDANQAGDTTFDVAPQVQVTLDVVLHPQLISVTAPTQVYVSGSYTLSATASSGLPVSYAVDASSGAGVCSLSGSTAHFLATGTCVIDLTQAGDSLTEPAPMVPVTFTVVVAPVFAPPLPSLSQVISVSAPPSSSFGTTYTLDAVTDSGLPVVYSVDPTSTSGTCTLSGATVSFSGVGTCVIDITQPGNTVFNPAPMIQQKIVVGAMPASVSFSPTASSRYGQVTRSNATVSLLTGTASGSVQFSLDGVAVGTSMPVINGLVSSPPLFGANNAPLTPGTYTVGAVFTPSDATKYSSASATTTLVVLKASTRLSVIAHPRSVLATASTLSPGTGRASGTVTFKLAGKVIGRAPLINKVATLRYRLTAAQARQLIAYYAGNAYYAGSSARANFSR